MTKLIANDPRRKFVPRFLPWLLGALMLAAYWFTLNHWVTLDNIAQVATVSGWVWQPQFFGPVTFLITYPFRWLPAAEIPVALNFFSALCAAATLAMLARSVILLPHDRMQAQRERERSDFTFLSGWMAWLPPVLAVALGGLQLTFWEHATNFTGEMLDLLMLAFVIWQVMEYRLDENPTRLIAAAGVFGAGLAENWALVGFFPLFFVSLIWLRKLEFFNPRFFGRLTLWGFGMFFFFIFLLPIRVKLTADFPVGFWEALKPNLRLDWMVVKALTTDNVRHCLALMSLTTVLPALALTIRWSPSFGDNSRLGIALVNYLFYLVHTVILTVCVWVMFDPPFSPRQIGLGAPSLTLYYLAALSIGYYSGYFLVVFGKKPVPTKRNPRPDQALPGGMLWLCPVIVAGVFTLAALAVGCLIYKNTPIIRTFNDDTFLKYARFTTSKLPPHGAVLLCDSESTAQDQPLRSFLIQAILAREGQLQNYPVVDTQSLNLSPYHRFLHRQYPKLWPSIVADHGMENVPPLNLLNLLSQISKTNTLCYLNPSFGYYFEQFYQEPHGLVYQMKPLPADTLAPPPLEKSLIADNETFWSNVVQTVTPGIKKALDTQQSLATPDQNPSMNVMGWILMHLHVLPEPNINAVIAGIFYSRNLDFWGVQLQRANELERAAAHFNAATNLNPDNIAAAINLDFNQTLRTGAPTPLDLSRVTADQFGKYRNWNEVLTANGPFDETSFCFENGVLLTQGTLLRQAISPFLRARELAPGNLAARLWLAQLYLFNRLPDRALEALHDPLTQPAKFSLTVSNATELNVLAAAAHFQRNELPTGVALLETEVKRHPDDDNLLTAAAQAFMMRGLYTNALHVIECKLAQTPDAPQWLFGQGYANLQLGIYHQAIASFTRVIQIQTNDPTARFNRALAYLQTSQLDQARADYRLLQNAHTNSFQVAFGLAEVAWRQHDTNEAIRNYQLYLANAPTNSIEATTVRTRLAQLRGK